MRALLLPGMDGSGQLHDEFVAAMAPRFRVEVVAYPPDRVLGYRQLQAFVADRLPGDAPFLLIGESFSGPIAIRIAASRPPGLVGLVLCATFAASPRPWLGHLRPLLGLPLPIPPARMLMPAMMGQWTTQEWTRREQVALATLPAAVARSRLAEVLKVDATADLGHIRVPALYLQASHDRLVPPRCWHQIHAHMPHAKRIRLRSPHFLLQHQSARAARAVQRHFAQLSDLYR
ncbi:alpha/beta fold hydrolase [Luteimonas sp. WGS1318]|uniref:alpha/beta fold hydrolase n=1 Tax=Luteimonas sp. WGS1318 TaxID=3366815 RepID=UPI00372D6E58